MQTCPACHAAVSTGATDCPACGHLFVPAGGGPSLLSVTRESYPVVLASVCGVLTGVWLLFASTWLVWVFPVAFGGSIGVGWVLSRTAGSKLSTHAILISLPVVVVAWFWLAVGVDRNYGYLAQGFATAHAAVVLAAFIGARALQRGRGV